MRRSKKCRNVPREAIAALLNSVVENHQILRFEQRASGVRSASDVDTLSPLLELLKIPIRICECKQRWPWVNRTTFAQPAH